MRSIAAILVRCCDRCLVVGFFLLEGGRVVDLVVCTGHVEENKEGVRESGTTGVGVRRKLEPERHDDKDPTRELPLNVGHRSRYLHCFLPWDAVEIRSALLTTRHTRQSGRSVTVFRGNPKLPRSCLCAGHFTSSEEDELCDALESPLLSGVHAWRKVGK